MYGHEQLIGLVFTGFTTVALIADRVTTGDLLVLLAAVVFAAATWRSAARRTLADDNNALRGRVQTLEAEAIRLKADKDRLTIELAEAKARPDMTEVSGTLLTIAKILSEVHTAVVPPASEH
jgi:hypothetical protein